MGTWERTTLQARVTVLGARVATGRSAVSGAAPALGLCCCVSLAAQRGSRVCPGLSRRAAGVSGHLLAPALLLFGGCVSETHARSALARPPVTARPPSGGPSRAPIGQATGQAGTHSPSAHAVRSSRSLPELAAPALTP